MESHPLHRADRSKAEESAVQLSITAYFMFGYQMDVGKFLVFFAALTLTLLLSESVAMLFAILTVSADLAVLFMGITYILLLSLTGFLAAETPVYYQWIEHINFIRCGSPCARCCVLPVDRAHQLYPVRLPVCRAVHYHGLHPWRGAPSLRTAAESTGVYQKSVSCASPPTISSVRQNSTPRSRHAISLRLCRYGNAAMFLNEMEGLTLDGPDGPVAGDELAPNSNLDNGLSVASNLAVLACMLVGVRFLGLVGLKLAYRRHWL